MQGSQILPANFFQTFFFLYNRVFAGNHRVFEENAVLLIKACWRWGGGEAFPLAFLAVYNKLQSRGALC